MKKARLLLYMLFPASALTAQTPQALSHWLYDLPLAEGNGAIAQKIRTDKRFLVCREPDTVVQFSTFRQPVRGRILKTNLPAGFNSPDSATIEMIWGMLSNTGQPEAGHQYAGPLRVIRIAYFYSDTTLINRLFLRAHRELKNNSKTENFLRVGTPGETDFGTGYDIEYINNKKRLKSMTLMKNTTLSGARCLLLEYVMDGDWSP